MKISIITVCFNSEATIELCLNSVASQSWANVEHIIVDGCSTDSTLQLIEENRQGNMVVVSEPDNGIYNEQRSILGDWRLCGIFKFG